MLKEINLIELLDGINQRTGGVYHADENSVYIHGSKTLYNTPKGTFIELCSSECLTIKLLNVLPNIEAKMYMGDIVINGMVWDGKKTNIELFID